MANQKERTSGAVLRALRYALLVVGLSLSLQTLSLTEGTDYFDNPVMDFAGFFWVAFVDGTYDLFYECFCDVQITKCVFTYKLFENQFGFPYKYVITDFRQTRAPDDVAASDLYGSTFLCDALEHAPIKNLTCIRLPLDDNTCVINADSCFDYLVTHRPNECSFPCSTLIFIAAFELNIRYYNFENMTVPVKDGVCLYGERTTTTIFPTTVFDDGNGNGAQENETGGHTTSPNFVFPINTNNTEAERNDTEPVGSPDSEKTQTDSDISTRLIYISTGGTVGLLMLVALVVFVGIHARKSNKDKEASRLTTGIFPLSSKGIPPSESPGSGVEEAEPEKYHTLDEMAMAAEQTAHVQEEFDDEGYIRFNDGDTRSSRRLWRDATRIYRPLPRTPKPPKLEQNALDMSTDSPYIYPDRSYLPRSKRVSVADVSTYNSLSSIYHKILDGTLPAPPMTSGQGLSEISETRPKPRPHCRLVSSDDHTYLGLVNLRPGLDIFGDVTEVKLVRSVSGDLELVNTDDESLAFTDYYTRIQLIQQEDRFVSVIGVLEKPSVPRVESVHMESIEGRVVNVIGVLETPSVPRVESAHTDAIEGVEKDFNAEPVHFGIVEDGVEPNTYNSIPSPTTPGGTEITSGGEAGDPGEENVFTLEIIYLGSLELAENTYLDPCDYMTFLDIEASCTSYDSDGYLIALDIDATKTSANHPPS